MVRLWNGTIQGNCVKEKKHFTRNCIFPGQKSLHQQHFHFDKKGFEICKFFTLLVSLNPSGAWESNNGMFIFWKLWHLSKRKDYIPTYTHLSTYLSTSLKEYMTGLRFYEKFKSLILMRSLISSSLCGTGSTLIKFCSTHLKNDISLNCCCSEWL